MKQAKEFNEKVNVQATFYIAKKHVVIGEMVGEVNSNRIGIILSECSFCNCLVSRWPCISL